MREKFALVASAFVHRIFARHLDVAAEGQGTDAVIGFTAAEAEQAFSESDRKHFDANFEELRGRVVAELVDQDHEAQHDSHYENRLKKGQHLRHKV